MAAAAAAGHNDADDGDSANDNDAAAGENNGAGGGEHFGSVVLIRYRVTVMPAPPYEIDSNHGLARTTIMIVLLLLIRLFDQLIV